MHHAKRSDDTSLLSLHDPEAEACKFLLLLIALLIPRALHYPP